MKNTKLKSVLQMIVILSLLASMFCLSGCKKKKPEPTESTPPTQAPTQTTSPVEDTKPSTPTTPVKPTDPTIPSDPTEPSTEETIPNDCDHILGNWIVDKVSTCTTEGSRYKECSLCNSKVETQVIPKTDHSPSSWITDKKATCQAPGKQHQECSQCTKELVYITVGKTDHKVTTISGYAATNSTPGRTDRLICKTCDAVVQESLVIPAIGSVPYTYSVNSDGKSCTITGITNFSGKEIIIPAALSGYAVTGIGDSAFANCASLTTVYIPKSITKIGAKAFNGCQNLTNITYQGTTAQWNTLVKGAEWNVGTGSYTVYCTNTSLLK